MKSIKLVIAGMAILMCLLLVSTNNKSGAELPKQHKTILMQPSAIPTEMGEAEVLVHAISYQLNQLYF